MKYDVFALKELLLKHQISAFEAEKTLERISQFEALPMAEAWKGITAQVLSPSIPFEIHQYLYEKTFAGWDQSKEGPIPAWSPSSAQRESTNISKLMRDLKMTHYRDFHRWSVEHRELFWEKSIKTLGIQFKKPYQQVLRMDDGPEDPTWFAGGELNIADSCFLADPAKTAIVWQKEGGSIEKTSYGELEKLTHRVARGLVNNGFRPGDAIAIDMVMTVESVGIYLGIIKAGCVAVSIADSFAPEEIRTRLKISNSKGIFTQDSIYRGGKKLPLYEKVLAAGAPRAIVVPGRGPVDMQLRPEDLLWERFLSDDETFPSASCSPNSPSNILFSSGTTGEPKAIPWTHLTPLKAAVDGHFHHDIQEQDVVAWPTNLGWMMGPWLIYASLLNRATMALFYGAPIGSEFCEFVQNAQVTILGLVPSVVKAWRMSGAANHYDWSSIKLFSSTGECSSPEDYLFLMSLAHYKPVIEYCGGTEIGGGYLTGTLVQNASPATFTTPSLGLDLYILDEEGRPSTEGEVFLVPPSIGLSQTLLNRDHHAVYYQDTPLGPKGERLRRHGDQVQKLPGGFYQAHGRADDTMNLGGIKVSSAEIERVLNQTEGVTETAAIAVPPAGGGPSLLVIYAVPESGSKRDTETLKTEMQKSIKNHLNPLFKIHDVITIDLLPRTASNKVMRRVLRSKYTGI